LYPLKVICRVLEVSTSGYYSWKKRLKSRRRIDNDSLLIEIRRVFVDNDSNYGSPRIYKEFKKAAIPCSENRVARLMREAGLAAVQRRKFKATTNSNHNWPVAPNLLERHFSVDEPNKIWVTDITYIWTWEGWLYLSFVLDLYSRGVVGLAMSERITDDLTRNALNQAIGRRNPEAGLIHHSDRGSQYASGDYQSLLKEHGITPSMSRKGDCWDNAVAESFIHTLKVEKINRYRFKTRDDAKNKIFEYVEMYYNRKRTHSSLGYLSPFDYEKRSFPSLLTVH
jgi:transposase InsO family protein